MTCPNCGTANRAGARFCDACGTPLAARPAGEAVARKVVTIIFADLMHSTALHEQLDAESVRGVMDRYYRALHGAVDAHGGTVVKLLGDGVMAAFGVPRVAEDDAIRAVRAAVAMQAACRALIAEQRAVVAGLGLRVAVNTGEVVVSADNADVVGDPVNVAARLQQEAQDGDVLVGESTHRLVADLVTLAPIGSLALKGRSESVAAHRVVSLERPAGAAATPFVGRDDEIRRLLALQAATAAERRARLAVVLGSPGLGKSRLLAELSRRLADAATVLAARCDAAGGTTFAEALRVHLGLADGAAPDTVRDAVAAVLPPGDNETARIAGGVAALLAGTPAPPEETFFVVRRLLAALAARRPLVLAIDDAQWAAPLLLDLAEHLVQWSGGTPLLVLLAARPELREVRASLAVPGASVAAVVTLAGLDAGAATRLAASIVGAEALPAAIAGRVLAASEGNPLFVGELVRMLVHDGALRREGERWTSDVEPAALQMPPTIHALLAARIERLGADERGVLERAAVVGRSFSRAAVAALLADAAALDAHLAALQRSEIIEPDDASYLGEPALRFHHALIRDAAYRRLLKGTRAELHGRLADWITGRAGGAAEHDEVIGWHLEQAHEHLLELGPADAAATALGVRAAGHLAAAGRRALARDDLPVAAALLGRAVARLDDADPTRAELILDQCEALLAAGDVAAAAPAVEALGRLAGVDGSAPSLEGAAPAAPVGDEAALGGRAEARPSTAQAPLAARRRRLSAWHACFAGQLAVLTEPQMLRGTADAVAAAAADLAAAGDAAGEAKGHAVHAAALARLGAIGASEAALDRALAAARRGGDRRRANAVLAGAPVAALWGPSPVTRASGRCLDVVRVLRITLGAPAVEAVALRCQAVLEALRGRGEAARRMLATSRHLVEELGITHRLLEVDVFAGLIELLEGDAAAAEPLLRRAYQGLRDQGLGIDAARAAALLARALLAQDRLAEAEALSHESEALAGDDLQAAIAWRGVRAEALARRGEPEAALAIARAAVDIAAATDALLDHADARRALSVALEAGGRADEAHAEAIRAVELWETKGATLLSGNARVTASRPAAGGESVTPPRRLQANLASGNLARTDAAMARGALDDFLSLIPEDAVAIHHPTHTVYREGDQRAAYASLLAADELTFRHVLLATLGERLALAFGEVTFQSMAGVSGVRYGAANMDSLLVAEVDGEGRRSRTEFFAPERLGDALACLYERYAAHQTDGAARDVATAIAAAARAHLGWLGVEAIAATLAPDLAFVDHRTVGFGAARGAEAFLAGFRSLFEVADQLSRRVDDVLDARPDALLVRVTTLGVARAGGGAFERTMLQLWGFDATGRLARIEFFDPAAGERALQRLASSAAPAVSTWTNAVVRRQAEYQQRWQGRDWPGLTAMLAPDVRFDDRRALVGLPMAGADFVANQRFLFDTPASRWQFDTLATRGERLALSRVRFSGESPEGGALLEEHLSLFELDAEGRYQHVTVFDAGALDAAYAALDERFAAGEGAPHAALLADHRAWMAAVTARDWDRATALLAEDLTVVNRRRFTGSEGPLDRAAYVASLRNLGDLDVHFAMRIHHLPRLSARTAVAVATIEGTLLGGGFEQPTASVWVHDGVRPHRLEIYDGDQLDAALARYEALTAAPPARFSTLATRALARSAQCWRARDWPGVLACYAADTQLEDRRPVVQLDLDTAMFFANLRMMFDAPGSSLEGEPIATRGERLALGTGGFRSVSSDGAPVAVDNLTLIEVDEAGRVARVTLFAADDLDAARAELDARFAAGEGAQFPRVLASMDVFRRAFLERDWTAMAEHLSPQLAMVDHRPLGWEATHGPAPYVAALRELVALAPDVQLRVDHAAICARGYLSITTWAGTHEGGHFEAPSAIVGMLDAQARPCRFDQYELAQLDEARAAFAALAGQPATTAPALVAIPANAATRVFHRFPAFRDAADWDGLRALHAPDATLDDRRPLFRAQVGVDAMVTTARLIAAERMQVDHARLAIAGDRLSLVATRLTRAGEDAFEIELLQVAEVDGDGRIAALVYFDPSHRRAAADELFERYAAGQGATQLPAVAFEAARAVRARDFDRLRRVVADDFVIDDRRRTGLGRIDGADAYLESLRALFALAPDVDTEVLYQLVVDRRGTLVVARMSGTFAGGGAFETVLIRLTVFRDGRWARAEFFELDDLTTAQARCVELIAPALNAAARVRIRIAQLFEHADWPVLRAMAAADFRYEDRRRWTQMTGGVDFWIDSVRTARQGGARPTFEFIGTFGDRVSVERTLWRGVSEAGGAFEVEYVSLTVLDLDGRLIASINFDPDDRAAAFAEAHFRFVAQD